MCDSNFKILKTLEQLINGDRYHEALEIVDTLVDQENLSPSDQLQNYILESKIKQKTGFFEKSLELAERALEAGKKLKKMIETVDALIIIIETLRLLGNLEKCLVKIEQAESILNTLDKNDLPKLTKRKFLLMSYKGFCYSFKGDVQGAQEYFNECLKMQDRIDSKQTLALFFYFFGLSYITKGDLVQALEYSQKSLELRQKMGYKLDTAHSLDAIGIIYRQKGDYDQALKYYRKALEIFEKFGNEADMAKNLSNTGAIFWYKGEFSQALAYHQQSLLLNRKIRNEKEISRCLNDIGNIYLEKGELDEALDCYDESLAIRKKLENKLELAVTLNNLGAIHHRKNMLNKSLKYLKESLIIIEKLDNPLYLSISLFSLISISLEISDFQQAREYFKRLNAINETEQSKLINLFYRAGKAHILKRGNSPPTPINLVSVNALITNLIQAQKLFHQITQEEIINHEITVDAIINLCELLLFELKFLRTEEPLKEVNQLALQLLKISEVQQSQALRAKAYFLLSKLALINLDIIEAQNLLNKAREITKKKGLQLLDIIIRKEQEKMLSQLGTWKKYKRQSTSIFELLEQTHLEELFVLMRQNRVETLASPTPTQSLESDEFASFMIDLLNRKNH